MATLLLGRQAWVHAAAVSLAAGCLAIRVNPGLARMLPPCPVHEYLGWLCPGCGATRALLALLHGRVFDALRWNALVVALLPAAVWFAGVSYRRAVAYDRFEWPRVHAAVLYGLAAAMLAFTVARNLV